MRRSRLLPLAGRLLLALTCAFAALVVPRVAGAQIKQPGAHPDYSLELDPHLVIQHARGPFFDDEGIGLGLRASIPFVRNGPISQINNNVGISFGADVAFFGSDFGCRSRGNAELGDDCDGSDLWLPVTFQWNFFFTKVVSAFFEPGLAVSYWRRTWLDDCGGGELCERTASDLDLAEFVVFFGGRFLFTERAGMTVRIGWPYVSVGATFLL
jgi:hypothetical protein